MLPPLVEEHGTTEGVDLGCMSAVGIKDKVVQMLLFADNCRVFLLQVTPDYSTIADTLCRLRHGSGWTQRATNVIQIILLTT